MSILTIQLDYAILKCYTTKKLMDTSTSFLFEVMFKLDK